MQRCSFNHRRSSGIALFVALLIALAAFGLTAVFAQAPLSAQTPGGGSDGTNDGSMPSDNSEPVSSSSGDTSDDDDQTPDPPPTVNGPVMTLPIASPQGFRVNWTWPTLPDGVTLVGFELERSDSSASGPFHNATTKQTTSATTQYVDSIHGASVDQLDSGSVWHYRMRAMLNTSDDQAFNSEWSAVQSVTVPAFPRPTDLLVSDHWVNGQRSKLISWSAPTLSWGSQPAWSGYAVFRAVHQQASGATDGAAAVVTPAALVANRAHFQEEYAEMPPALPGGRWYHYTVRARYGVFLSAALEPTP